MISFADGSLGEIGIMKKTLQQALSTISVDNISQYQSPTGLDSTKETIQHNFPIYKDHDILITSSATEALYITFLSLQKKGYTKVFCRVPVYFGIIRQLLSLGVEVIARETLEELTAHKDSITSTSCIYLTSGIHGVFGSTPDKEILDTLASIQQNTGCIIVEDNPYDTLYFNQTPIQNYFDPLNTITIGSMSKILGPSLRIGWITAHENILGGCKSAKITISLSTPYIDQSIVTKCISQEYIEVIRNEYKTRYEYFSSLVKKYNMTLYDEPQGGIFACIKTDKNIDTVVSQAKDQGVVIEPNKYYYPDNTNRSYIRVNFVKNNQDDVEQGLKILSFLI